MTQPTNPTPSATRAAPAAALASLDDISTVLCQSAIQATCRALHAAQVAADMIGRHEGPESARNAMTALRDALLDAYSGVPDGLRRQFAERRVDIDSDELLELLSIVVRGESRDATTTQTSTKEP